MVKNKEMPVVIRGQGRKFYDILAENPGIAAVFCDAAPEGELYLLFDDEGVSLCLDDMTLTADFTKILRRIPKNRIGSELLVKAAKINGNKNPSAVDATAGLGEDAFLLAAAGFSVTMFERDPVIALLLADALRKARDTSELKEAAGRMELIPGDSIEHMNSDKIKADVVVLDPMFPERQKSALVKKKFQLLHLLECPCTDENELLAAAMRCEPKKIVIKRPVKGPYLAGITPSYSTGGKAVRYDVLLPCSIG